MSNRAFFRAHLVGIRRILRQRKFQKSEKAQLVKVVLRDYTSVVPLSLSEFQDDLLLLGARTLEGLNLVVNSHDKKVVAAGPIPAAWFAINH